MPFMASLSALKRNMALTLVLVFGILFAIVMILALLFQAHIILVFAFILPFMILQWALSSWMVARATRLQYLKKGDNPWLEETVEELAKDAKVPMPRLAVVQDQTPNAFVFGRSLKKSTLAVHTGLLHSLNKKEIKAVLAHEVGHLKHRDVIIMTIASFIPLLAFILARSLLWGGILGGGRRNNNGGALIAMGLLFIGIYVVTQLLILRLSRMREFYADSYSATSTRDPHSLASALAKITYGLSLAKKDNSGLRSFYIGDPASSRREIAIIMAKKNEYDLDGNGVLDERELELAMEKEAKKKRGMGAAGLFSTHPPTFKRILLLKEMEKETR